MPFKTVTFDAYIDVTGTSVNIGSPSKTFNITDNIRNLWHMKLCVTVKLFKAQV